MNVTEEQQWFQVLSGKAELTWQFWSESIDTNFKAGDNAAISDDMNISMLFTSTFP
ncbi:hypothetical protein [Bacillus canaveralius]|uniref:hypothetical protein n=1 Tax=Bacillus canaveralius TaxID=1403243 RepID=UPI0016396E1A|nr:hypothetical protein [Bacillus canaveralius]